MLHTDKSLRITPQRLKILEVLKRHNWHPTADEVYDAVRRGLPRISLGTVYRNLEILARQGLIKQVDTGLTQKRYDGNPVRHFHLRCLGCGLLEDAPYPGDFDPLAQLQETKGFQIHGFLLEFVGLCPQCLSNPPETARH